MNYFEQFSLSVFMFKSVVSEILFLASVMLFLFKCAIHFSFHIISFLYYRCHANACISFMHYSDRNAVEWARWARRDRWTRARSWVHCRAGQKPRQAAKHDSLTRLTCFALVILGIYGYAICLSIASRILLSYIYLPCFYISMSLIIVVSN
jgi:hypothetical protein